MLKEKTLLIIKPDIVKKNLIGKVISIIEENNITIEDICTLQLTIENAQLFYMEHKNKNFFNELIEFITSSKIVVLFLTGENIIEKTRKLIGHTNFKNAEENTIRKLFATSLTENAVHASDSKDSSKREINIIKELLSKNEY